MTPHTLVATSPKRDQIVANPSTLLVGGGGGSRSGRWEGGRPHGNVNCVPHVKTGEQECGERLQVAELLVHHNTLNSKTLTHQLGGGKGRTRGLENGSRGSKLD